MQACISKSLTEDGNPKFATISKVTKALGCKLDIFGEHFRVSPDLQYEYVVTTIDG